MAKFTKDDIEKITTELSFPWGVAVLLCDGFRVTVRVVRARTLKYTLCVYVNGWMHANQVMDDCEERKRFMCPCKARMYSSAKRQKLIKAVGVRLAKKMGVNESFTYYSHNWNSARSMLRHFAANNTSVELVGVGYGATLEGVAVDEERVDA